MNKKKKYWLTILAITALYTLISALTIGCPFRFFFGISCPGCGMSRSLFSLLKGDIHMAFFYHPLFFLVPVLFYSIYRYEEKNDRIGKWLLAAVLVFFFLVWILRLFLGSPVTAPQFDKNLFCTLRNTIQSLF